MRTVFVDTSALLCLLDRREAEHAAVVAALHALDDERSGLLTTSYTLAESGALIRRRLGVDAFRKLGEFAHRALEIIWVDEDLHRRGWNQSLESGREGPGLVDCVAFHAMSDRGVDTALAVDRHFTARFAVLPVSR